MVLNEMLAACRIVPLFLLVILPFREHVPYSVDRSTMLTKQAEERAKAMAAMQPIVTDADRYMVGELPWHKYREDLLLIQRQIERCRQNSQLTASKTRRLGCFVQRGKLHAKQFMLSVAKSLVGFGANLIDGLRGPGGFFLFLQMAIVLGGTFMSGRWFYYNVFPSLVEVVGPYLISADVKPEAPRRCSKPYIGMQQQNMGLDADAPGFGAAGGFSVARDPSPVRLLDRDVRLADSRDLSRQSDTDGEDYGEYSGQQRIHGADASSSEECLRSEPDALQGMKISPRVSPRDQRGDQFDSNQYSHQASGVSSTPGLDQVQPAARAKKRVAFKDDDRPLPPRTTGSVGGGIQQAGVGGRGGRSVSPATGGMSGDRAPSTSPTRGTAGRFGSGAIRGRQSASVGRIHTAL